ncbi:unnamed protein product, partial [Rangifer tarandus platyrhynchus]
MAALGLTSLLGLQRGERQDHPFCVILLRKVSSQGGKPEPSKQPLKKPKLPEGHFDAPEDSNLEKKLLTKFPDDINPVTKEKGGEAQNLPDMEIGNEKEAILIF